MLPCPSPPSPFPPQKHQRRAAGCYGNEFKSIIKEIFPSYWMKRGVCIHYAAERGQLRVIMGPTHLWRNLRTSLLPFAPATKVDASNGAAEVRGGEGRAVTQITQTALIHKDTSTCRSCRHPPTCVCKHHRFLKSCPASIQQGVLSSLLCVNKSARSGKFFIHPCRND